MSIDLIHAIYTINTQASSALYRQVMEQTKQGIRAGLLQPGQQLPSVRVMASSLQVNPMTISKAYSQLEQQGVLEKRKGIGMLVAEQHNINNYSDALLTQRDQFVTLAKQQKLSDDAIITLIQDALSALSNRT
ncbi:GntR family transcriptional regulator [Pseudoalteromonas sp. XMcav1-K]|uniref:GntR family transcriptional regulator n=1 Tax=Pseudoalteromonas sp. XMcav1-K TaxID=3374372 RepID=UPI00375717A2